MVPWVELFGYDPPVMPGQDPDCLNIALADIPDAEAKAAMTDLRNQALADLQKQLQDQLDEATDK